jgi:hypothetical protein
VIFTITPQSRSRLCTRIMEAPEGWRVRITEPLKSRIQEEKYHAMIGDIADQYVFCERLWDAEDMKRLCIDQFRRDTINDTDFKELWAEVSKIELAPSLDGSGTVALGVQSRRFQKKLAIAFIEWLFAFGSDHDIAWSDPMEAA